MLRCREVSKLVSESMEHELHLRQRLQVWMHLAMCRMCAGFARQLRFLRRAARANAERFGSDSSEPEPALSQEARERMKAVLRHGDS
ncbi:MAG: anti-sigma factor family protein [Thermoguttaceae bacterium]